MMKQEEIYKMISDVMSTPRSKKKTNINATWTDKKKKSKNKYTVM